MSSDCPEPPVEATTPPLGRYILERWDLTAPPVVDDQPGLIPMRTLLDSMAMAARRAAPRLRRRK